MSKSGQHTDVKEDKEDEDLKDIIQKYIEKSKELEKQESKVLRQVELIQSALSSLQSLNRKFTSGTSHSVHVDAGTIEEETRKIKEETERIQREVRLKMEENKKLQEEIERRKSVDRRKENDVRKQLDKEGGVRGIERREIESRMTKTKSYEEKDSDPEIQFFKRELQELQEMSKALQKESMLEERNLKLSKNEKLKGKSKVDRNVAEVWNEKLKKK